MSECSATSLKFGQYNISSKEGAQQGDPLGPLYFCIGIHDILSNMQSDIAFAYLNDMVLAGDVSAVANDFLKLETEAIKIGLTLNRNKCKVIGHNAETRLIFESPGIDVQETELFNATLLGAPLIDSTALVSSCLTRYRNCTQ